MDTLHNVNTEYCGVREQYCIKMDILGELEDYPRFKKEIQELRQTSKSRQPTF
ncbi:hypothetical protein BGX38DRAFT_1181082 [Terfezia claveryi]|nr:hypothetical protein BGX38DRAFT_1181082 [Terfezia claveryi]